MPTLQERLYIRVVDVETIEIVATPLMLLSLTGDLLSIAQGDPTPHGYDTLRMSGVQLDEGSESLLLCHVADTKARSRYNDPTSPEKLEPLQFVPGYGGLQPNASKDGLISLSGELIQVLMAGPGEKQLLPGKELGADSLAVRVILQAKDAPEADRRSS